MSENEDIIDAVSEAGEPEEVPPEKEASEEIKRPRKRRLSSNKIKILIVVGIIAVALTIVLWGASPPEYINLDELMEKSDSYIGEDVTVRGKVGNWTGGQNFTMVDAKNESIAIQVVHDGAIPEGFAEQKDVVVEGRLENRASGLTLITTEIQVGCPSKY